MSTLAHDAYSHHLPPEVTAHQQRRAVLFFILADSVFFACLLFTYFYLRSLNVNGGWLPGGTNTGASWLVWLIAGVTVLSALAYRSADLGIRAGQRSRFQTGALGGILLLLVAIGLMIYQALTWPILMSDGSYASVFILMSTTQLVHAFVALIVAVGVWNRGNRGLLDGGGHFHNHATVVGYWWYWVSLTAVLGACTTFFVR